MKKSLSKSILKFCLFTLFVLSAFINCEEKGSVRVLKLAHVLDINHPVHKGMVYMADKAADKSGGKIRVDIYPSGQLGAKGI